MQLHCARLDQKRWGGGECLWQEIPAHETGLQLSHLFE